MIDVLGVWLQESEVNGHFLRLHPLSLSSESVFLFIDSLKQSHPLLFQTLLHLSLPLVCHLNNHMHSVDHMHYVHYVSYLVSTYM